MVRKSEERRPLGIPRLKLEYKNRAGKFGLGLSEDRHKFRGVLKMVIHQQFP
jgi:hypothetical protein